MPRRKTPPKKPVGQIRVLIVDDDSMVRKAWKRVLNNSKQIQVIGEVTPRGMGKLSSAANPPEIIVAGHSFMEAGFLRKGKLRTFWKSLPKIILIVETQEQVKRAFRSGADFSVAKPFDSQDLITWVRALSDDAKRLCSEYHDQLSKIKSVPSQNGKYSDLVSSILQLLFHPDLINPEEAHLPAHASHAGRFVFRNQAREHRFWIEAHDMHKSKYVTIDIYNGSLKADQLKGTGKYLSESHGLMGLVIGRSLQPNDLQSISSALFENENKIVLPVSDMQLQAMLAYKAGGVNPVFELEQIYQKIIADSEN